jgi:hypothetical protein
MDAGQPVSPAATLDGNRGQSVAAAPPGAAWAAAPSNIGVPAAGKSAPRRHVSGPEQPVVIVTPERDTPGMMARPATARWRWRRPPHVLDITHALSEVVGRAMTSPVGQHRCHA